jgi:hypothetical protein
VNSKKLLQAIALTERLGHVFIVTAYASGRTHLAAARTLSYLPDDQVMVSGWFCHQTIRNLHTNRFLSIVAWEPSSDEGYQLQGELIATEALEMLNGYNPELEKKPPIPQVDRQLKIRIEKVVEFNLRPHSDLEE